MEQNPYRHFLADQDARAVLATTPGLLHQAACELTPEQIEAPVAHHADGSPKWSPREIAAHLADCELAFGFRLRQTLASQAGANQGSRELATIQPFDQDAWARHYAGYDMPAALETYRALRAWNLKLVASLAEADFEREILHPERGTLTFRTILETMAGHDLNHLAQVQKVAAG